MFYRESLRASLLYALLPETIYLRSEVSEVAQLCPTLGDPVDCSPPGSSVHETLWARILEWVAVRLGEPHSEKDTQGQPLVD